MPLAPMHVLVTGASGLVGGFMVNRPLMVDDVLGPTWPARIGREAAARNVPIAWTPLDVGLRALAAR